MAADSRYFDLFGLPSAFDLDLNDLATRYRELARALHPDRFARGSDEERRLAAQKMAELNEAYRALKHPISRARCLLGIERESEERGMHDPAFLSQQMELRERLDEARDAETLEALARDVRGMFEERERDLRKHLSPDSRQPEAARRTIVEMQFLDKLLRQIEDLQEQIH